MGACLGLSYCPSSVDIYPSPPTINPGSALAVCLHVVMSAWRLVCLSARQNACMSVCEWLHVCIIACLTLHLHLLVCAWLCVCMTAPSVDIYPNPPTINPGSALAVCLHVVMSAWRLVCLSARQNVCMSVCEWLHVCIIACLTLHLHLLVCA